VVVGEREDVRDVLVTRSLNGVKRDHAWDAASNVVMAFGEDESPRIGTSSLRRTAQIHQIWPSAQILSLRGNVDTRLRKLDSGEYDGIILASAGLHRMQLQERLAGQLIFFPVEMMMPAPGQGALGVEIRDEQALHALLAPLRNVEAQAATSAERAFMRRL